MLTVKKSLGQHFLKDEQVLEKITAVLKERPFERLLEVGPGGGALTRYLIQIPDIELTCVELDHEKVDHLLRNYPRLRGHIMEADILAIDKPFDKPFTLIGNFPYNISTQIVFRVLEWKSSVETMIGMFQKEVAERIAAPSGSKVYGVTSVLVQAFFKVDFLFEVDQNAFTPPPKVKSAVIRLIPREKIPLMKNERFFINLVKTAFNQRRKTLRNAVRSLFDEGTLEQDIFNKRAEQLSVEDFAALSFEMKQ